jgi:hypothetical protein
MKKFISTLIIISTLAITMTANAAWITKKIRVIYPTSDGTIIFTLYDSANSECTNSTTAPYFYLREGVNGVTPQAAKNLYALALTSIAMNKSLSVHFDETSSFCYVDRISIIN